MQEMAGLLEQWRMDTAEVRRRMYRAPTPRERERWHAVWLLAQGWTAAAVGRALERDAHTIGQWVKAFARAVPRRWFSSKAVVPPRVGRGATRGVEGSGTGLAVGGGHQRVELELEGGAAVCSGPLWPDAEPESTAGGSELLAPAGVCAEASSEAVGQGGPGASGNVRGRVCDADGDGATDRNQDILR